MLTIFFYDYVVVAGSNPSMEYKKKKNDTKLIKV